MATMIKLNGTVINRYVLRDSLQIDEAVGERSTCSFTVITKGEITVETGNIVEIYQDGELIFAGTVDTPEITKLNDGRFEIYVQCVDWHQICDRRIVSETYENRFAGDIVSDIVEKYLREDGIHGVPVARTETTQSDFAAGTLSGVVATAAGDLELTVESAPTFTRSSVAYLSNGTQVEANVPRFEAGKFGQAVMVEEGTTNLLTVNQSSVETDLTGLAIGTDSATLVRDTTVAWHGSASAKATASADATISIRTDRVIITAGSNYTASVYGKSSVQRSGQLVIWWFDSSNAVITYALADITITTAWKRFAVTATAPSNAASCWVELYYFGAITGDVLWWDGAQLEAKPYATSFIDGTRSPETLTIPTAGVLNPQEGTVEFWFKLNTLSPNDYQAFFTSGDVGAPGPHILIMREYSGGLNKVRVWDGDGATEATLTSVTTLQTGVWYYVAFTWSPSGRKLYVNGVLESSNTRTNSLGFATLAKLGSWLNRAYLNDLIDDLRISSRARTDAEIAAAYQNGQPLPVDEWTTYKPNFDGSLIAGKGGYRTSSILDLSPVGIAASSSISWTATTPVGTGVTVETSLDGGATWQVCTNGGAIPGIKVGDDLTGKSLLVRQTLSTTDTTVTPKLHDLAVRINSSNIQDGPIVQEAVFSYVPATNVLDKLSDIAGFTWWIDSSKQIHFCDRGTFTAPFPIDSNAKIMNVKIIKNRDNYRNRQYIRGGKGTTDPQTEIFKGNGAQKTFTVAFPIAKEPTVYVNDVQKTVGIKGVDSGKDWYWNKGDPVITQDELAPALQSADTLRIVYQGMFDIIALSTDFSAIFEIQSLEGGSGIYESVVEEPYITTIDAAFQTANALLKRYAKLGKIIRFETYATGLHAGQIITINLPVIGAVGEFLIASVQYQSVKSFEYDYLFSVEAVSNFATNSWTKFFRENLGRPKTYVIRENVQEKETLIRLVPQAESVSWADSQTYNIYQCFFPSDSIYPSDTLFTC